MTTTIKATYVNGVLKPAEPLALAEGAEVELTLTTAADDDDPLDAVIGICTDGPDIRLAERHDKILYGPLVRRAGGGHDLRRFLIPVEAWP